MPCPSTSRRGTGRPPTPACAAYRGNASTGCKARGDNTTPARGAFACSRIPAPTSGSHIRTPTGRLAAAARGSARASCALQRMAHVFGGRERAARLFDDAPSGADPLEIGALRTEGRVFEPDAHVPAARDGCRSELQHVDGESADHPWGARRFRGEKLQICIERVLERREAEGEAFGGHEAGQRVRPK